MKTTYHPIPSTPAAHSGDQAQNHATHRKWSALALGGFLFTSLFALPAPLAEAQCQQWNVGHGWRFKQGTINVDLDLQQKGTVITGTASHVIASRRSGAVMGSFGESSTVVGDVDGTVEGDQFAVKIYWNNNTIGVYEGTIRPSGKIEGKGYEQRSPRTKARWYSETRMVCADATAVQPTNPPPKVLKNTGQTRPSPAPKVLKSTGKGKTQSAPAAPTITANTRSITIPDGQTTGTVKLTWDAGPDHPSAEVWMKEGTEGEEKRIAEQAEGTRPVTVERGKNYQFLLMDAGEQLAKWIVISGR